MKKRLFLLFILISVIFLSLSCEIQIYFKPHEPGIYIDEDALAKFHETRQSWLDSGIKNYSYTYVCNSNQYYEEDNVFEVIVTDGDVSSYELIKYEGKYKKDMSQKQWEELIDWYYNYVIDGEPYFLLIENIYKRIDESIYESENKLKDFPETYYANFNLEFDDNTGIICVYEEENMNMTKTEEKYAHKMNIKIENFRIIE